MTVRTQKQVRKKRWLRGELKRINASSGINQIVVSLNAQRRDDCGHCFS